MSGKESVVKAVGLSKEFRDFWNRPKAKAVNDIDFEVYEGEVLGLLGPNGSGKSTTIKMLLGLLYPTAGSITVFGESPRSVRTKMRIGYLPEESYLYKYLTAMETLDFFGALFNLSAVERRSRSEQLLEMVGLSHVRNRPVGEFSKGMARRIGLAQAMINDPDLLILDEPTSGLDPIGCKEIKDLITFLQKRGKTVIVSSHLLGDVEDICNRVLILYGGVIRASGTLDELLTISSSSRITTPLLEQGITERLVKILRDNLKGEEFVIDHPRRTLEDFFLDVVNKARSESVKTYGAEGGGEIAGYLKEESRDVLKELVSVQKETKPEMPVVEKEEEGEAEDESGKSREKIDRLATHAVEEKKQLPELKPPEDREEINKKLSHLVSKKDGKH
ncbi:MAG: ABC transporter ATP-binding protein [Lentisphaerae bacterium GWF2_49_21]|nr:MAG: ABC transporter ATP-binding protein [Lentisphaerae bacterium GWF2_49_21]